MTSFSAFSIGRTPRKCWMSEEEICEIRVDAASGKDSADGVWAKSSGTSEAAGQKPATFDFLGFTHICARSRRGKFTIHVRTMRKRLRRSLKAVTAWCREHRHDPVEEQQKRSTGNSGATTSTTDDRRIPAVSGGSIGRLAHLAKWLNRRTRGNTLKWEKYTALLRRHPLLLPCLSRPWNCAVSRSEEPAACKCARSGL